MDAAQLDAVSAVLGAIAASAGAGAGDAVKDMTKTTIMGTRDRLIARVRGLLKNDPVGDAKLTVYAAEPTPANGHALQGHLLDASAEQDQEILTLARELLQAAGPAALAPGSVAANVITQVNRDGGIGFIGGEHAHHHRIQGADRVSWELIRLTDTRYELRNIGKATASNVGIAANVQLDWLTTPDGDVPAESSVIFTYHRRMSDPSPILTVSCSASGSSERQRWQRPLPL